MSVVVPVRYALGIYGIERRGRHEFLVRTERPRLNLTIALNEEPDLFLRFAELPKTNQDYLAFVSSYGLLGLCKQEEYTGDWEEHGEPLIAFEEFHRSFRRAFKVAKSLVEGEPPVSTNELEIVRDWLGACLNTHTRLSMDDLSGDLVLYAMTLAGTLVLQLYRFLIVGQELRVCALPHCGYLTTRRKFCSSKHQKLFNTWKHRGKVVLENGVWMKRS